MSVSMQHIEIKSKVRAILCFGPATDVTGMKAGEYYQVVIDPEMVSPGGEYIRFSAIPKTEGAEVSEIHGWQRVAAITVCEILDEGPESALGHSVTMRAIVKE